MTLVTVAVGLILVLAGVWWYKTPPYHEESCRSTAYDEDIRSRKE